MLLYGRDYGAAEGAMMSQRSKRELLEEIRPRYRAAKKTEKQHILDEFVAATSYHRKYAIRILKQEGYRKHTRKRGRQKIYQGAGAMWRAATTCRYSGTLIENESLQYRSLPEPDSPPATSTWFQHHQTRVVAQKGHPGANLHSLERTKAWFHGN
jgi:hypothetical protein